MLPIQIRNMSVRSLHLIETGRYQPMYFRPYEVNADGSTYKAMADRLARSPNSAGAGALAGIASQAIMPSALPLGDLAIPNSWNEKRIRFMLIVDFEFITGMKGTYWIQGYTSYNGVSQLGNIDPFMTFYANSCTTTAQTPIPTPFGVQISEVIRETVQILSAPSGINETYNNWLYSMRPEDVYNSIEVQQMSYGSNLDPSDINDKRCVINYMPAVSSREHNIPTDYIGKILSNYIRGREMSEFGSDGRDIITTAASVCMDKSLRENMFFQYISSKKQGSFINQFTIKELNELDPNLANKTTFFKVSDIMKVNSAIPIPDVNNSEHWMGADITTQMASMLAEAIPSIMLQSLISVISFRSTNHDIGGKHSLLFSDVKSLSRVDIKTLANLFQTLYEQRILPDLTMNGMIPFMLDMHCDIAGDTWITLKLDNYPSVTFSVPSFCDGLFTPVVTNNLAHLHDVSTKIDGMLNYIATEVLDNTKVHGMLSTTSHY